MQVTIEDGSLVYIYLRRGNAGDYMIPELRCELLFDAEEQWLGLRVYGETLDDGLPVELPRISALTEIPPGVSLTRQDNQVELLFDQHRPIARKVVVDGSIDAYHERLNGIELILPLGYLQGKTARVEPFCESID
ncbi:hypothetical protein [Heliophilum fasciatum]|uniref:Uncharacterized protein n=1 Tax=Heliophilum fasciatum TaxID=35700 RepID=A0A4R2RYT1_9FIRM|nr:hypothetical protein [Heliophilum fasciatum]MCW2277538.1 hypothetical protein [Heliophilum fasciatum]TCP65171.1 hypothetical protein EDD73_10654 [Heliophilum fasciatum]